jgi:hypothetical protein
VVVWIGNTEAIASKHYLQVTEDHFAKALQNALQHPAVLPRTGSQATLPADEKTPVLQGFAAGCEVVQSGRVEDRGLEPGPSSSGKTSLSQQGNAESNAFSGDDPQLQLLIERWPTLSKALQQQIMLLVG